MRLSRSLGRVALVVVIVSEVSRTSRVDASEREPLGQMAKYKSANREDRAAGSVSFGPFGWRLSQCGAALAPN